MKDRIEQTIEIDFTKDEAIDFAFEEKIKNHYRRIVRISAFTKESDGSISFKNCVVEMDIRIADKIVFPMGYNLGRIYSVNDRSQNQQVCNIPIENDEIISGKVTNPNNVSKFHIVLTLEK